MDELSMLRKKVLDLEKENRLVKETEKKLQAANEQLQTSEQQLKSKQETLIQTQRIARVGSWEWDVATDTVSWSDELFHIFKLNPENGAVSYANHSKIYTPESMQGLDAAVQHTLKTGEPYEIDLEIIKGDGTHAFCTALGYAEKDEQGKVIRLLGSFQDITERKNAEEHLKKIEWLLQNKKEKTEIRIPDYGDLTTINQNRTILDSVGKEVLKGIVLDYLSLLETSAAVYEKNGDYAVGIFSSEWCQFMDCSSRALCKTKNNKKALDSGKWLCHESCWADASNQSIHTNKAVDIECSGGLHIYAIPIRANNEVIGSINFGYGNPPTNEDKLKEIAANYKVSADKLKDIAQRYETRPAFIIDIAKEKLETSSKLIGNIVERKQMEEDLRKNQKRYEKAQTLGHVGNWEYDPVSTNFWASDEAKRIYGYDLNLENFSTEIVESCIPEKERVHQALIDLLEYNKKYDLIFDIITYDKGIRKTIHSIAELERDAQGNPLTITGVINDITKQQKAEDNLKALNQQLSANEQQLRAANQQLQANEQQLHAANQQLTASEQQLLATNQQLRANEQELKIANHQLLEAKEKAEKSEERFNLAMNASNDGLFDWNLETNEIYYSPGWKKMLGYEDHEIPNDFSIWEKTTAPEDVKRSWEMQQKLITKEIDRFVMEFKMKHKQGHWVDILSRAEAIFDGDDKANRIVGTHVDISNQKIVELELIAAKEKAQESEEKYKALYENAPLSYQSLNEDGSFNDVNPTWLSTLGYKREEVIGKFYKDFLHPDWKSHFEKNFPAFKKRGYVSDVQFKIRHKKGHYLDISFEGCIGYHPDGSFKQTYCVFQDITEKQQALEELVIAKEKAEENERKLIEAQELSHIGSWEYIIDTDTVTWSKELYNIFERSLDLPAPKYSLQQSFYTEESFIILDKAILDCVQREIPYEIELDIIASSGSIKQIISKGNVIKDQNNKIIGSYGTAQDITQKKKIERELIIAKEKAEENEEKYREMANLLPQLLVELNLDGEITYVNQQSLTMFGYTYDELIGKSSLIAHVPEEWELIIKSIKLKYEGHEFTNRELNMLRKDGSVFPALIFTSIIYKNNEPSGLRAIVIDISEQKKVEQELILAKEKAEESELQFKQLFESEADAVFIADEENGIILDVNRAGEKLMQMQKNEIIGLHQSKLHPQNSDEFSTKSFTEHKQSIEKLEDAVLIENKIVRKDGVEVPVEILASKVRYQGKECQIGTFRDITERKKAEEALRKSEEMIISSQSVANICSYSTTLNENKLEKSAWICSPEFYNIFGIDETYPHTIAGWVGLIHPDYRDKLADYHEYVVKNKISFHHQYKIIRINDGVERWVEGTGELEYDTQGNPIRMYGAIQDITERKKVENELLEKEVQYHNLANSGTALIWASGLDKLCFYFNDPWLNFTGRTLEQEYGNGWAEGVHPDDFDHCLNIYVTSFDKKVPFEMEYRMKRADGEYRWILDLGTPNYNSVGEFLGYIGHCFDITDRKKIQNDLIEAKLKAEENEERWENLFKNSPNAIAVYEAVDDGNDFVFSDYNLKAQEIDKLNQEKVLNKRISEVFPAAVDLGFLDVFKRVWQTGLTERMDVTFYNDNRINGWRENVIYKLNTGEIVAIYDDITELKKAEEALVLAKEKAEESDRLKSAFLANMSHEIRTPMNGILGFAELLKEADLTSEQQQKYIDIIGKSGARMLNIINDIVDISKIESGQMKVALSETNVNEQLEFIYKFFQAETDQRGLQLTLKKSLPPNKISTITDREKLYSVLTNLVKNAIKYTKVGSIEFGCGSPSSPTAANSELGELQFYVKDTGIGIPKQRQEAIFERFIQADYVDKMARQGAGLGLAISKAYVEMLGGKIWVESEEGKGSTFYFTLPFHSKKEPIIQATDKNIIPPEEVTLKKLKTLIVEDDESSSQLISILIQKFGKEILTVQSGDKAVEVCRNHPDIDLILMDIQIPVMDGYEATRQIREFNNKVIIVAQTAYALAGDMEKAIETGCNDYISKPIKKDELIKLITKYFNEKVN